MDIDSICRSLFVDNYEILCHLQSGDSDEDEEVTAYVPLTQKIKMQYELDKREICIEAKKTQQEWNEIMESQLDVFFEMFEEEQEIPPDSMITCRFYFTDEPFLAIEYHTDEVQYPFPFPLYINLEAIEGDDLKRKWKKLYVFSGLHCIPSYRFSYLDEIWGIFLRVEQNNGELLEDDMNQIVEIAQDPNQNLIHVETGVDLDSDND